MNESCLDEIVFVHMRYGYKMINDIYIRLIVAYLSVAHVDVVNRLVIENIPFGLQLDETLSCE